MTLRGSRGKGGAKAVVVSRRAQSARPVRTIWPDQSFGVVDLRRSETGFSSLIYPAARPVHAICVRGEGYGPFVGNGA